MNIVSIIPTGIGCELGGHAGDGTPVAKLLGACCDNLITHPNAVNGSDLNEMPENALYVEGSMLDRFLEGDIELQKVNQNKVLVAVNSPVNNAVINTVSAARANMGLNAEIVELKTPLRMIGGIMDGKACGNVSGWEELVAQVSGYDFDALAINTLVEVDRSVKMHYFRNGGINPWGGVEAICSKLISYAISKPVAHAPEEVEDILGDKELYNLCVEIVDPRISAEVLSMTFLHCVLKGLHKAPKIGKGLSVDDIDFLVTPPCKGRPHYACIKKGIPIIVVKENKTVESWTGSHKCIPVNNYWEAAGIIMSAKAGILPESVRRPLKMTKVIK